MLRVGFEPTPFWTRTLIWCLIQRSIIPSRIQRSINLPFSSRAPSPGRCPQSLPLLAGALRELPLLAGSLSLSLSWPVPSASSLYWPVPSVSLSPGALCELSLTLQLVNSLPVLSASYLLGHESP
jgi:hypothetical protein